MGSWAKLLAQPVSAAAPAEDSSLVGKRIAVVDANVMIAIGRAVTSLGDVLITTEEVLAEVRDGSARQAIAQVQFRCRSPSDSAVNTIAAFARKTGDLHQLSLEDLRLLALVYTLEEELHGVEHLRCEPAPVKTHTKQTAPGQLPGWGNNGKSEEWDAIDEYGEDQEVAGDTEEGDGRTVQSTTVDSAAPDSVAADKSDNWEAVKCSRNAVRRAKRKEGRKGAGDGSIVSVVASAEAAHVQLSNEFDHLMQPSGSPQMCPHPNGGIDAATHNASAPGVASSVACTETMASRMGDETCLSSSAPVATAAPCVDSESSARPQGEALRGEERDGQEELIAGKVGGDGEGGDEWVEVDGPGRAEAEDDGTASESVTWTAATAPFHSNVVLVTSDFPMQNVALQIGLRLESKGGQRITCLQRFSMRCLGCHTVCANTGKLFCPACGHATLTRVSLTIGADGAEQYGVRKKHVLRGTRYSLPKPRGGRNAANPILSEDVYKAKVRRKKSQVTTGDLDEVSFGELKKHANQPSHIAQGLSHLSTNWRNNPNERKNMARSNRRR